MRTSSAGNPGVTPSAFPSSIANPRLHELVAETGEITNPTGKDAGMAIYVDIERDEDAIVPDTPVDTNQHFHTCATGTLILANRPRTWLAVTPDRRGHPKPARARLPTSTPPAQSCGGSVAGGRTTPRGA